MSDYREFSMLRDNADEVGLAWNGPRPVERIHHRTSSGRTVSGIRWGNAAPQVVLLHGGGQNAHTWDTVVLALDRPALAIDLPGHGHSEWRSDHRYLPEVMAPDVAETMHEHAPDAAAVVGMSLGGLTSLAVVGQTDRAVARLGLVDITPGVNREKASEVEAFLRGPETFESFDAILERTVLFNPTRTESSLRRGILHNARENADGSWTWRYDRPPEIPDDMASFDPSWLWDTISAFGGPLSLFRGSESPVVDEADVAEVRRRRPDAEVHVVAGAGHSIQGDRPIELAGLIDGLLG